MLALGFASFLVFGVVLVLLGANQAELARALELDLSRTGLLGAALAGGVGVGVVGAGPLIDRQPRRPLFVAATGIAAAALFGFSEDMSFARALVCAALLGLGAGVYDAMVSTLVAERYGAEAARPMSLVHAGATLGAVAGPFFVGWISARSGFVASFHGAGAAHVALALLGMVVRLPAPAAGHGSHIPFREVLRPALLPFALVSFAYVGVEGSLTLFAEPYAAEALDLGTGRGLRAISALWLGLFAGRLALTLFRGPVDARHLMGAGLLGAAVLAAGAVLGVRALELHFAITGLSLGFIFPLMVALVGDRIPEARGSAIGLTIGAGALGGFVIPWLHGAIGDAAGAGVAVGTLATWCLVIAAAAWSARWRFSGGSAPGVS